MDVRRATTADWEVVRDVRLRALADAPQAFRSTYDHEAAFADSVWVERLATETNATFVCENDGHCCGVVTLVQDTTHARLGWLVGMWVAPSSRGSGAADVLVASVLQWAADRGITRLRADVAEGNTPAERLYNRHGFTRTGESFAGGRPGLVEIAMERPIRSEKIP